MNCFFKSMTTTNDNVAQPRSMAVCGPENGGFMRLESPLYMAKFKFDGNIWDFMNQHMDHQFVVHQIWQNDMISQWI